MDFYSMLYARKSSGNSRQDFKLFVSRNLTTVTEKMLDGITSIRESAFRAYSSLTSIEIPDSVTSIGIYAFYNCRSLTSVTIGEGVTSIGTYAFCDCRSLTSIEIPDSVTSIGDYAFDYCTALTSVTIGEGVTNIGSHAFYGCSSLKSVTVRATTPPTLGAYAFDSTSNQLVIYVPAESVDAYKAKTNWAVYKSKIQAIPS